MSRAEEKRAFDAMMAEIDDDSDEDVGAKPLPRRNEGKAEPMERVQSKSASTFRSEGKDADFRVNSQAPRASEPKSAAKPVSRRMSAEEQAIDSFGSSFSSSATDVATEKLSVAKRWLTRPLNSNDRTSMKCFVERERSNMGLHVIYRCFLEGNSEGQAPRFMMSAKKKVGKQSSYYLISLEMEPDDDRGSESVVGKVRGNTVGSRYIITDHGIAPDRTIAPSTFRKEYGVVSFEFDSGGPSKIDAWVPQVTASGVATVWQPISEEVDMESHIDRGALDGIVYLKNKTPKWDEGHGGHVLNFQGRVTESSVKNFQLSWPDSDQPDDVILQFGRVGKHKFNLDLRYPLCPLQAFAISVACLDGKIADRKGYELFKRMTGGGSSSAGGGSSSANSGEDRSGKSTPTVPGSAGSGGSSSAGASGTATSVDGSMKGSNSLLGGWRENLPSGQYLRDRISRNFK